MPRRHCAAHKVRLAVRAARLPLGARARLAGVRMRGSLTWAAAGPAARGAQRRRASSRATRPTAPAPTPPATPRPTARCSPAHTRPIQAAGSTLSTVEYSRTRSVLSARVRSQTFRKASRATVVAAVGWRVLHGELRRSHLARSHLTRSHLARSHFDVLVELRTLSCDTARSTCFTWISRNCTCGTSSCDDATCATQHDVCADTTRRHVQLHATACAQYSEYATAGAVGLQGAAGCCGGAAALTHEQS